jgi:ferritin
MYIESITNGINKALSDELSAATLYFNLVELLSGVQCEELREELAEHGDDEMSHFKMLLGYAHNHGIQVGINLDASIANQRPVDFASASAYVQELEMQAINLYEGLSKIALTEGDLETHEFFKGLMEAEMGHFDDVAKLTGEKRSLARFDTEIKSVSKMSFGDYLNSIQDQDSDVVITLGDEQGEAEYE